MVVLSLLLVFLLFMFAVISYTYSYPSYSPTFETRRNHFFPPLLVPLNTWQIALRNHYYYFCLCPLFTLILETSSQKKIDTKFQKGLSSLMELGDSQPPPSSLIFCQIVGKQIGKQDYRPTKHPQRKANGCEPLSGNYVTTFWNFFRIN